MVNRDREVTVESVSRILERYGVLGSLGEDELEPNEMAEEVADILNMAMAIPPSCTSKQVEKKVKKAIGHLDKAHKDLKNLFPGFSDLIALLIDSLHDELNDDLAEAAIGKEKEKPTGGRDHVYTAAVNGLYWRLKPWIDRRHGPAMLCKLMLLLPEDKSERQMYDVLTKTYLINARKAYAKTEKLENRR